MISYQSETLFDVIEEIDSLLQLHYEELCLHKDRVKLDPMWNRYTQMERDGSIAIITARDDGKLIGYALFFVGPHIHYSALKVATNDVLFLHPDYRVGRTGLRLIRACEQHFEKSKADGQEMDIVWRAKIGTTLHSLLGLMRYNAEEVAFRKPI